MQRIIKLGRRVVAQTKLRVFKGVTDSATKIVSVFEPDTKILRRGKAHKPTEFGQMVKVQEAEGGIVTDIAVVNEHDSKLLVPSVEHHQQVFGRVPGVVATDRGFFSLNNIRDVETMGVRCVAVPKPGHRSPEWIARERRRPFRRARAWRAGGEARIARLKRAATMRLANPAFVPRNHRVAQAVEAAVRRDDFEPVETLVRVLGRPYEDQPEFVHLAEPPRPEERVVETFSGT